MQDESFDSMPVALKPYFDEPLAKILCTQWHALTPDDKRDCVNTLDLSCNPARKGEKEEFHRQCDEMERRLDVRKEIIKIEQKIKEWESKATPTATDYKIQQEAIKALQEQFKALESISLGADKEAIEKTPPGITKQQIITAFEGIKFNAEQWSKYTASVPGWLLPARMQRGTKSVAKHPTLWNPVLVAVALLDSAPIKRLDAVFQTHKFLSEWAEIWTDRSEILR